MSKQHITEKLEKAYRFYVRNVSSAGYAISLPLSQYLLNLMDKLKAKKILDLGSGFSSYVLRLKGAEVWTIDTNSKWLEKTEKFLEMFGEHNGYFALLENFSFNEQKFDIVFLDTHPHTDRYKLFEPIKHCCTGAVVFDDAHSKPKSKSWDVEYIDKLEKTFEDWIIINLSKETKDKYGRYAYVALKRGT